ncbi:MAG: deoxyribodipyrimidine photo-lyase [Pseudomonadota bacterium]
MSDTSPLLYWIRRDFRLGDHPGISAAAQSGRPVIPVFILDPETEAQGAASKWRLNLAIAKFRESLREIGSDLVLRRGTALSVLRSLVGQTNAGAVHWTRLYDPAAIARDKVVKSSLREDGVDAESHPGHVMFEPWSVRTKSGDGFYKVYSPFWRAVEPRDVPPCLPPVQRLVPPQHWPICDTLEDWDLGAEMGRGGDIVARFARVGEDAARARLKHFVDGPIVDYSDMRDRLDRDGTSALSQNFTYGELSVREAYHAAIESVHAASAGALNFRKELVWREFAWHLIYHTPHIVDNAWRQEWNDFPWRGDNPDAERWRRGMTGEPVVDAAMRQLYVTGTMHNRARMIVASYLTKHLMTDWRVGMNWFADCLIDWDPASNALGWQWSAGCGPDATPYFRVFNPATQAEKFDPDGTYRKRYLLGLDGSDHEDAKAYFDVIPKSWGLAPGTLASAPVITLKEGRERALSAYGEFKARDGVLST